MHNLYYKSCRICVAWHCIGAKNHNAISWCNCASLEDVRGIEVWYHCIYIRTVRSSRSVLVKSSYILRRPQNFTKSPPIICPMYCQSNNWWRFCRILWPSQNIWTLMIQNLIYRTILHLLEFWMKSDLYWKFRN